MAPVPGEKIRLSDAFRKPDEVLRGESGFFPVPASPLPVARAEGDTNAVWWFIGLYPLLSDLRLEERCSLAGSCCPAAFSSTSHLPTLPLGSSFLMRMNDGAGHTEAGKGLGMGGVLYLQGPHMAKSPQIVLFGTCRCSLSFEAAGDG